MPAPPYSVRFLSGVADTGTTVATYTVPAGKRAIVRQFTLVDASPGGTGCTFALSGPGFPQFALIAAAAGATAGLLSELHVVFDAGETFSVYRANGSGFYGVHGYLLDAT